MRGRLLVLAALALQFATGGAQAAFEFSGVRQVVAVLGDGTRTPIGQLQFTPVAGGATFKLTWRTEVFTDHFLSMREFKCLPGAKEISCHVPYPYANPARVAPGDLGWLEHHLLFLHKSPSEFGAKLWNGVLYEFRESGNTLVGTPKAVDLNEIAAPPANPGVAPYGRARRHDVPAEARWLRAIVIE